jgi:hypothetical protein
MIAASKMTRWLIGSLIAAGGLVLLLATGRPAHAVDYNCSDFATQAAAQSFFLAHGGPSSDPYGLDADHDGIACESNPCPCSTGTGGGGGGGSGGGGGGSGGSRCGEERWAVKTLSDKRERLVNFKPKGSSVRRLRKKASPGVGSSTPRIKGVETTTYRVQAQLDEMKLEDDHDVHLVISQPGSPSETMIVEFPDTSCNGAKSSPKKAAMSRARAALISACGQPSTSSFTHLTGGATVTGVGFFDVPHGQTGVAPNAIELHPVLRFTNASCQPG